MRKICPERFSGTPCVLKTERRRQSIVSAMDIEIGGLLVEVHPNPNQAWSDGEQSLDLAEFDARMASLDPCLALRSPALDQPAGALRTEAIG